MNYPKKFEDIDAKFLTSVLPFGEITEIHYKDAHTQGYSSKSTIVEFIYADPDNTSPKSVFLKFGLPERTTVYPYLYKTELKWLQRNSRMSPKFYFGNLSTDGYYILIIEHLKGRFGLQKDGTSLADVKTIIKEWATFQRDYLHGCDEAIGFKKKHDLQFANIVDLSLHFFNDVKEYPKITDETIQEHAKVILERWDKVYSTWKSMSSSSEFDLTEMKDLLDRFNQVDIKSVFAAGLKDALGSIQSIIHNDFRTDHFCFLNDGKLILMDWQAVATGTPLVDVAKVTCESLNFTDFKENWQELLDIYSEALFKDSDIKLSKMEMIRLYKIGNLINLERLMYLVSLFGEGMKDKKVTEYWQVLLAKSYRSTLWAFFNIKIE